jgi:hypothetical protein
VSNSVLSFSSKCFLIGELLLGKLSETVVVHGNAPHDRPRSLVSHLIGNRASFLCTKAPMLRVPDKLSGWHSQDLLAGEATPDQCTIGRCAACRWKHKKVTAAAALSFLDYEEFIGAKKHLVLGSSSNTGPPQESNSFAIGK